MSSNEVKSNISQQNSEETTEKRQINQLALLQYVTLNMGTEWFTPENVYDNLKKAQTVTVEEILECLFAFKQFGFVAYISNGVWHKFRMNCAYKE